MKEWYRQKTAELVAACRKAIAEGESIVITGHDCPDADSVISAVMVQGLLGRFGIEATVKFPTPPDNVTLRDMKTLGLWSDSLLRDLEPTDLLLLVDHHKTFYKNSVIGCVDHHTTPPEPQGECAIVVGASSAGKVIYDMLNACEVANGDDELLALYSVYLDTQSCRSLKFNRADLAWTENCIEKFSLDRDELTRMGFCLNDADEPVPTLAMYAYKRYEFGNKVSASTCIQIDEGDERWNKIIFAIVEHLKEKTDKEGYAAWVFAVNKPALSRSDLYFIHDDGRVEKRSLDRLASRSRDVIPVLSAL